MVKGNKMFETLFMNKKIFAVVFIFIICVSGLFANKRSYGEFLLIDVGSRPISLGGSYVSIADDIFGMEYNPAGTFLNKNKEFAFTHIEYIGGATIEYIAHKRIIYDRFALGASLKMFSISDVERDDFGIRISEFKNKNYLLNFNISSEYKKVFFGANLKYLHEEIYNKTFSNIIFDVGVLKDFKSGNNGKFFRTGLVVSNIGADKTYGDESFSSPVNLKAGTTYYTKLFDNKLLLSLELQSKDFYKILGIEYYLTEYFAVRTGFSSNSLSNEIANFNFGVGLIEKIGTIDYSFKSFSDLGNSHSVSLNIRY